MSYSKLHILISRPFQILMTILVMLFVIAAADGIILAITEALTYWQDRQIREFSQIRDIKKELTAEEQKQQRIERSITQCQADGTIHFLFYPEQPQKTYQDSLQSRSRTMPTRILQVYDTNDNLIWEGQLKDIPYQYLGWSGENYSDGDRIYSYDSEFDSRRLRGIQTLIPELTQTLEIRLEMEQGRLEFWRYDPAKDFLVGFEARGPKIGYISAPGFTVSKTETQPFGKFGSMQNFTEYKPFEPAVLWQTDRRLYQIDLQTRKVEVLFESPQADIEKFSIRRCVHRSRYETLPYLKLFDENCRPFIDCKMQDKSHHLILMEPLQHLTITMPADWANWQERKVEITATGQDVFLHRAWTQRKPTPLLRHGRQIDVWRNEYLSKPLTYCDELYRVKEDGALQLISSFSRTKPARELPISIEQPPTIVESAQTFLRAFSSPLYTLAWNKFEDKISDEIHNASIFLSAIGAVIIKELHPDKTLPNLILSVGMIVVALWHGWPRRTSWGKLVLWLIIVGAFNLAGLMTYLALNHTPVIKCPACGKKRGLEMDNCSQCGSPLPIPQRKPTDLIMAN